MRMTMTTIAAAAILFGLGLLTNTIDAWVVPPAATRRMIGYQQRTSTSYAAAATTTALFASYNSTDTSSEEQPPSKKKGYVRVEERNAQHKASLQWEEKVKFDGTRHGNRWQQHEILRQNLFK